MPTRSMISVLEHLRKAVLRDGARLDDGELLCCFIERHDEAALGALVKRHGPMVYGMRFHFAIPVAKKLEDNYASCLLD